MFPSISAHMKFRGAIFMNWGMSFIILSLLFSAGSIPVFSVVSRVKYHFEAQTSIIVVSFGCQLGLIGKDIFKGWASGSHSFG